MNSKGKESTKEWAQMNARGGSIIVQKNINRTKVKNRKRNVEYLAIGYVDVTFIIIFKMCRREGI